MATQLVKNGHEVAIIAPETRRVDGVRMYEVKPPQMGVFVGNPELEGAKKYESMSGIELGKIYTTYIDKTLDAVKEFQPEVIHAFHTVFLPPVARLIKILYGMRFIITTHGSDLHYLARDRRLVGLIKDAVRVCAVVTANSNFTRRWFLDMFGHEWASRIRTIPGGVYIEEYKGNDELRRRIDKKYNLSGKKVVLFTGRLTVHKGVEYLIKAARKIKGEVLILGDGPERPYLEKLIKDYKLTNTRILGYMSPKEQVNFKEFYARADVYVAPSTWDEPLGLVILEAMAAKTPVIVTRKGGVTSLVKDGYNGYLVRPRNAEQIAQKVNYLLENDELRRKMGQRAHEIVAQKYTWQDITKKFENIYRKHAYTTKEYLHYLKTSIHNNHKRK